MEKTPKVTWVVLFFNREALLRQAMAHNIEKAGFSDYELVMVDNGSTDGATEYARSLKPDTLVINKENMGVSHGYNRAMVMARGEFIVITGMDMLMPDNWMTCFLEHFEKIPNTGVASMYTCPLSGVPERARGGKPGEWIFEEVNGLRIAKGMPFGRRMFRTSMLKHFGYFQHFGLYGYEDIAWAGTVEKYCAEHGLRCYAIPDKVCEHIQNTRLDLQGPEREDYVKFKKAEVADPYKLNRLKELGDQGWPAARPFP